MSFTDGKPFVATPEHCKMRWSGAPNERFRCGLCGHRFYVGDVVRFVYANGGGAVSFGNFMVCSACDGPDVLLKRMRWSLEAATRFWELSDRPLLSVGEEAKLRAAILLAEAEVAT